MKGLDQEIKKKIDFRHSLEKIITEVTDYITVNYNRLKREVIEELKKEYY